MVVDARGCPEVVAAPSSDLPLTLPLSPSPRSRPQNKKPHTISKGRKFEKGRGRRASRGFKV